MKIYPSAEVPLIIPETPEEVAEAERLTQEAIDRLPKIPDDEPVIKPDSPSEEEE
jgi:hypothetical protein